MSCEDRLLSPCSPYDLLYGDYAESYAIQVAISYNITVTVAAGNGDTNNVGMNACLDTPSEVRGRETAVRASFAPPLLTGALTHYWC